MTICPPKLSHDNTHFREHIFVSHNNDKTMSSQNHDWDSELRIELINKADDIVQAFDCVSEAFGRQAEDGIWTAMNPGWDTLEGKKRGASRMVNRWRHTTKDKTGNPNTLFLKATLPGPEGASKRSIVGLAIWAQASSVEGYGDRPVEDLKASMGLEDLYPGNESEQRYLCQVISSMQNRRREVIRQKESAAQPAVFILDLCAVDPLHQKKGIARELVKWGLAEAQRRGNLEAITEASIMGRNVYAKAGFKPEGVDIEYYVDDEFASRKRPANLFMRTHDR
jgi:GNAT superfamily N-acetyltransferase